MEGVVHSIYKEYYSLAKGVRGVSINVGIRYSTIYESLLHLYMCLVKREDLNNKDVISLIVQTGFNVLFKPFLESLCKLPYRWYVTREDSSTLATVKFADRQEFHGIPLKEGVIGTYFGEPLFLPNAIFLYDVLNVRRIRASVATRRANTKTTGIVVIIALFIYVLYRYDMIARLVSYMLKGLVYSLVAGLAFYVLRGLFRILWSMKWIGVILILLLLISSL